MNLGQDAEFMLRAPLCDPAHAAAKPPGSRPMPAPPILDTHEFAAGKLAALLDRRASRDLFDTGHHLLRHNLDQT